MYTAERSSSWPSGHLLGCICSVGATCGRARRWWNLGRTAGLARFVPRRYGTTWIPSVSTWRILPTRSVFFGLTQLGTKSVPSTRERGLLSETRRLCVRLPRRSPGAVSQANLTWTQDTAKATTDLCSGHTSASDSADKACVPVRTCDGAHRPGEPNDLGTTCLDVDMHAVAMRCD